MLTVAFIVRQSILLFIEGEGEVAFFSAKRWDRRNRADLIESATPCHDAQVVELYRDSNLLRLTILAAMSEDYTMVPQHLQHLDNFPMFLFPLHTLLHSYFPFKVGDQARVIRFLKKIEILFFFLIYFSVILDL